MTSLEGFPRVTVRPMALVVCGCGWAGNKMVSPAILVLEASWGGLGGRGIRFVVVSSDGYAWGEVGPMVMPLPDWDR